MTFGKPRQTDEMHRCLLCGAEFPDHKATLHHAGRTPDGDFWNTECPECGTYDMMNSEYAELSDEEFREQQHQLARDQHRARKGQRQ